MKKKRKWFDLAKRERKLIRRLENEFGLPHDPKEVRSVPVRRVSGGMVLSGEEFQARKAELEGK